jgi:hypothetical protein
MVLVKTAGFGQRMKQPETNRLASTRAYPVKFLKFTPKLFTSPVDYSRLSRNRRLWSHFSQTSQARQCISSTVFGGGI